MKNFWEVIDEPKMFEADVEAEHKRLFYYFH